MIESQHENLQIGKGNWEGFTLPLGLIHEAADEWKKQLEGVDKPWLCWNVSDRWCQLQQRLVQGVGWTPVLGHDPRIGPGKALPGSVVIDFNRRFQFSIMWLHFPIEFTFLYAPRLAFWHADLLCGLDTMRVLAHRFEALRDGEMAAVPDKGGRRNFFSFKKHRYWELVGCTTRGASADQFSRGAGWWRHIECHPACKDDTREREKRSQYYYDSGVGIMYWKRNYGGKVADIPLRLVEGGHCTSINQTNYQRVSPKTQLRNLGAELDLNYRLEDVAARLGIAHLL